jgi:hypothetical protein
MGVKHGGQEYSGHMSREKPWPNLKGCSVKEGGRKGALNDVFRRPTVHIPIVCTIRLVYWYSY